MRLQSVRGGQSSEDKKPPNSRLRRVAALTATTVLAHLGIKTAVVLVNVQKAKERAAVIVLREVLLEAHLGARLQGLGSSTVAVGGTIKLQLEYLR